MTRSIDSGWFDEPIPRNLTYSLKWEAFAGDIMPMWVADMDFRTAPEIIEALKQCAEHGIFGYTNHPKKLTELIIKRLESLYSWKVKPEELMVFSGIVPAMNALCRIFDRKNAKLINYTPVYYPFFQMGPNSGLRQVNIQMRNVGKSAEMDFDQLESELKQDQNLILLSNPQNPLGRVFRKSELEELAKLVLKYDAFVASDEIHCDLILEPGLKHVPLASLNDEIAQRTISFLSPTKTWNIAGVQYSFAVVKNEQIRREIEKFSLGLFGRLPVFSYNAALAAYRYGQPWLDELLNYLRENRDLAISRLDGYKGLSVTQPMEATYLMWINHSQTGIENFHKHLLTNAKVGLSDGAPFGSAKHVRMNLACPRKALNEALDRIIDSM